MNKNWFDVDKAGLAATLERRGSRAWAVHELISNALDAGAKLVEAMLEPLQDTRQVTLMVRDNSPEGWLNLDQAYTMFARSRRADDPDKRGRFNLGEKLVLSMCKTAVINTMQGTLEFTQNGRKRTNEMTGVGTRFTGTIVMNRQEMEEIIDRLRQIIPPVGVQILINGIQIVRPQVLASHPNVPLPTEIADEEGSLRRRMRQTTVVIYEPLPGEPGGIFELGMPVCEAEWPWRVDVMQKVPLNFERDAVTPAFRKALQVAVVNLMSEAIPKDQVNQSWVQEGIGHAMAKPEAVKAVIVKQFGENAVIATPGQPMSNAQAAASGHTVIAGGSLSADVWANVKKHEVLLPASRAFPTAPPTDKSQSPVCPVCHRRL